MYTPSSSSRKSEGRRNLKLDEMTRILNAEHDRRTQEYTPEQRDFIQMMMQDVMKKYPNQGASSAAMKPKDVYSQWDESRGALPAYERPEYVRSQTMQGRGAQSFMTVARPENLYARETRLGQASGSGKSGEFGEMPVETRKSFVPTDYDWLPKPRAVASGGVVVTKPSVDEAKPLAAGSPKTDPSDAGTKTVKSDGSSFSAAKKFTSDMMNRFAEIGETIIPVFEENDKLKEEKAVLEEEKAALEKEKAVLEEEKAELLKTNQDLQNFVGLLGRQYVTYKLARDAGETEEDKAHANQAARLIIKTIADRTTAGGGGHEV